MGSIVPFLRDAGGAFGPDDVEVLSVALDRAMAILHLDHNATRLKETIARRIVIAAQTGVRDPDALLIDALGGSLLPSEPLASSEVSPEQA